MAAVQGLFGPVAIGVICGLLFVEEMGVPLPMFPASGLLLVAGVMITAGDISPWLFLPLAYVANVGGALAGYGWSRRLGQQRLERLADRLRVRRHLDLAARRLHRAGSIGVAIGRVLPGSRVYTSLIAGVVGVPLPTFIRGVAGADLVWLGVLVGLGMVVGIPAADYLHVALSVFIRAVVVIVFVLASVAVLRFVRPAGVSARGDARRRLLPIAAAISPDVAIVAVIALAAVVALTDGRVEMDAIGIATVVSITLLLYVGVTRTFFGATAGERLARVAYRELIPDVS